MPSARRRFCFLLPQHVETSDLQVLTGRQLSIISRENVGTTIASFGCRNHKQNRAEPIHASRLESSSQLGKAPSNWVPRDVNRCRLGFGLIQPRVRSEGRLTQEFQSCIRSPLLQRCSAIKGVNQARPVFKPLLAA